MNDDGAVLFERYGRHVAVVTLNRPHVRNAINMAITKRIEKIIAFTEAEAEIRVIILTGAGGKAFCAGADLKEIQAGQRGTFSDTKKGFAGFVDAERQKPWIAAVNGPALAGGLEIALACDLMIACDSAVFGLPEVSRGLVAASGGLWRLTRALPKAVATEMILSSRPISAQRAFDLGLLSGVLKADTLMPEALQLANEIAAGGPAAVRQSLLVLRQAFELDQAALQKLSREARDHVLATEDYKEGVRAFMEKRAPVWKDT